MPKILIIEDDPFLFEMYAVKLTEEKFDVEGAIDGQEGIKKIAQLKPDLVLLDLVLPKIDGFKVLKEIKSASDLGDVKVVILTNLGQKEDLQKGFDLGADDYIIKAHFTPSEVVDRIKKLLNKKIKK